MLSILIPCYNYNCYPLVKELNRQATLLKIVFEIICIDDASNSILNSKNEAINKLPNTTFSVLKNNLGRSAIRNHLASQASYDMFLFLDADVTPKNKDFIKSFITHKKKQIVFGGIECSITNPKKNSVLRWKYSISRECNSLTTRNNNPYFTFSSACFYIQKQLFNTIKFDDSIKEYGCEDVLFAYNLKQQNTEITHIENTVYHDNIESSTIFINKTTKALTNLHTLIKQHKLPSSIYTVSKLHNILKKYYLTRVIIFFFSLTKKHIIKNLLSQKPSLLLFDFYRLGYFSKLN